MHITDPASVRSEPRPFGDLAIVALALLAIALIWGAVDARLVEGVPVSVKPAKFSASFVVHFATLALIAKAMSPEARRGRLVSVAAAVMAAAFLGEMAYLFVQAAQAEASHFNLSTPFHQIAYQVMGVGAVLLISMPLLVVRAALRDEGARLGASTREGLRWGAWLSFILTLIVAGTMSNIGRHVGVHPAGGATLPILGWSGVVGDLRPAHFLSLHALQALPLLGLWLDRRGGGATAVRVGALIWTVLTLAVFAQALMGWPLIRL